LGRLQIGALRFNFCERVNFPPAGDAAPGQVLMGSDARQLPSNFFVHNNRVHADKGISPHSATVQHSPEPENRKFNRMKPSIAL
jgi:hypothetical protein